MNSLQTLNGALELSVNCLLHIIAPRYVLPGCLIAFVKHTCRKTFMCVLSCGSQTQVQKSCYFYLATFSVSRRFNSLKVVFFMINFDGLVSTNFLTV